MSGEYLSIEDVARQLDLHPKTVRRFIADGRLAASRAGRKWRVSRRDLDLFLRREAGGERATRAGDTAAAVPGMSERVGEPVRTVRVSAVVDVEAIDGEEAMRISSSVIAALNGKDPGYGPSRFDHLYYPDERRAQYIFWGEPEFVGTLLRLLSHVSRPEE